MINPILQNNTLFGQGLQTLFQQLEQKLELKTSVNVFLAGGMAVNLYTGNRTTTDVDVEFSKRISIPKDLVVFVTTPDGKQWPLYIDTNYNSSFALMHKDYLDNVISVDFDLNFLQVKILSPLDLVVSKIARLSEQDRDDISALVQLGLTDSNAIKERSMGALGGYIGNTTMLQMNIHEVVTLAKQIEEKIANTSEPQF